MLLRDRSARRTAMRARRLAARLWASPASDLPVRLRQAWVRATDPAWRPPPVGNAVPRWPLPLPRIEPPRPPWRVHGVEVPERAWTDWDRDPATGRRWPRHRFPDPFDAGMDPRGAWEVCRLQHVALRALGGDRSAADAARAFVEQVPPGSGIAWAVPLEAAVRLVSLVLVATAVPDPALSAAVAAHAAWIAHHPSRGSSANNHRVAELGALALAGRALGNAALHRQAARELPAILRAQIHLDGAAVEQSPSYLAFGLEWALLARTCGVPDLDEPLDRAAAFLCALLDGAGHAPRIGDDDGGRVVAATADPEPRYVASVAGTVRVALGRRPPPGWAPDLRTRLLVGAPPVPTPAPARSARFPAGGLTVLRSARAMVVVDHGPLGGCTLAAHGHADAASVWVHLDDAPLVVDRGTFRYHPAGSGAGPHGRRFDRCAGAHPTVVIDGVDPSVQHPVHPFLWRHRARAVAEQVDLVARRVTVRVDRAAHGVVHRRTVLLHDDRLVLLDELVPPAVGPARRHVAIQLPLAPGLAVEPDGVVLGVLRNGVPIASIHPDPAGAVRCVSGGPRPGIGWHAVSYGVAVPAAAVVIERWARLPVRLRTVIAFGRGPNQPTSRAAAA